VSARDEPDDATQILDERTIAEWRKAICGCVPGSRGWLVLNEPESVYRTPPEPKAPEGFFISALSRAAFKFRPGMAGTEDPDSGIADACPRHASEARGLPEGTRREPDTDGRANQEGSLWRRAVESAATEFVLQFCFAASRGSTNAGGEDFGYFAPWEKRVRIPPLTSRTVEAAPRGPLRRGSRFFCQEAPALTSLTADIACSPACLCDCWAQQCALARRW
jgi:hypothetical protein